MAKNKLEIFNTILDECDIENLFTAILNRVMVSVKEPTTGIRHTNMRKVREILNVSVGDIGDYLDFEGDDVDLFIIIPMYKTDLYFIVGHDVNLMNYHRLKQPNAFTMWKRVVNINDETDDTDELLNVIIVIGEKSPFVSKDNILHIIKHELTHCVLAYLDTKGLIDLKEIENQHGSTFIEFLCDFLPFYVLDGPDWICESSHFRGLEVQNKCVKSFLGYISKNFDDNVQDEYISYIDELHEVITQYLAPF